MKKLYICLALLLCIQLAKAQSSTVECSSECPNGDLELAEIHRDSTFFCTKDSIKLSGLVDENSQVTFRAGGRITFKPGFRTQYGSELHALTDYCGELASVENRTTEAPTFSFSIAPNPIFYEGHIAITLSKSTELSLQLSTVSGRVIHTLVHRKLYEQGAYTFQLDTNELPVGIYFATLHVYGNIHTKRILVAK